MESSGIHRAILICVASLAGMAPLAGPARAADATSPSTNAPTTVETLIVTATKRATNVQSTPLSIQSVSSADMEVKHLDDLADVSQLAAGVTYLPENRSNTFLSIRGTAVFDDSPGANRGSTIYVDEVPTNTPADALPDLFDIDHVEILRGPQGTLFGQNVAGGAIVISTIQPSFDPDYRLQATYGSNNLVEMLGSANGPISDTLAGRISFKLTRRDDYIDNTTLDDKTGGVDEWSARAQLLWRPVPNLSVRLAGDILRDTGAGIIQWSLGNFQPTLFGPLMTAQNLRDTSQATNGSTDRTVWSLLAREDWQTRVGTLVSITSYREVDDNLPGSAFADPGNIAMSDLMPRSKQYTEELRFVSPDKGFFTWVAGLYALRAREAEPQTVNWDFLPNSIFSDFEGLNGHYFAYQTQIVDSTSLAAYGEGTLHLPASVALTVGGRYTWERKTGSSTEFDQAGLLGPANAPLFATYGHSWSAFTPKATVAWQPTHDFMAYATVSEGFISGGYDLQGSADAIALSTPFNPEYVWNYEGGLKSTWFGERLRANVTIFDMRYTDLQVVEFVPPAESVTANAGAAFVRGVESDFEATPVKGLVLDASYAYYDAKFTNYISASGDFTGNTIPNTPKNSLYVSADYTLPVNVYGGSVRLGGDVSWRSTMWLEDGNSDPAFVHDKTAVDGLINLRLGWTSRDGRWSLLVWGKNVTNVKYVFYGVDVSPFFDTTAQFLAGGNTMYVVDSNPPPTFGVTLALKTR